MKKAIFMVVLGLLVAPLAKAQVATSTVPSDVYILGDNKGYDVNQTQVMYCFGASDQMCYKLDGAFWFIRKLDTLISDLQNRVATLESKPASQPVAGAAPSLVIDTAKGDRVKGEIQSYISGLNSQIDGINNSLIPMVGIRHFPNDQISYGNKADRTFRLEDVPGTAHDGLVTLETYPDADRIAFKDLSLYPQFPVGFPDNARKFVYDNREKIDKLQRKVGEIAPISFEVDDYLSTGVVPSVWDRSYLQSLGIIW